MAVKIKTGKLDGDDELRIESRTGTVVADRAWGRSTGGGYIDSRGGSIHISNTDVTRLFVKDDNGQEFEAELQDTGVTAREGHRVTFVYATNGQTDAFPCVAFINHSTERWEIFEGRTKALLGKYNLNGCCLIVVIFLLSVFLLPVFAPVALFLGAPVAILLVVLSNKSSRQPRQQNILARIRSEVQRLIDEENTQVSEA